MRLAIEQTPVPVGTVHVPITLSGGVASFGPDGNNDIEQLIEVADKRLYLAKQKGRNRIVMRDGKTETEATSPN